MNNIIKFNLELSIENKKLKEEIKKNLKSK